MMAADFFLANAIPGSPGIDEALEHVRIHDRERDVARVPEDDRRHARQADVEPARSKRPARIA